MTRLITSHQITRQGVLVFTVAPFAVLALAAFMATSAMRMPSISSHGPSAHVARSVQSAQVGDCYYDPYSGTYFCDNYTPPVWGPGTGGWTGPYDPGIYDPSYVPPVWDPGTGGWTGPYNTGGYDPALPPPVWDPGTGGFTG